MKLPVTLATLVSGLLIAAAMLVKIPPTQGYIQGLYLTPAADAMVVTPPLLWMQLPLHVSIHITV